MHVPEVPDHQPAWDMTLTEEFQAEIDEQAYHDMRRRLFELDISPLSRRLFTVSHGETHLQVFSRGQESSHDNAPGTEVYPVLRLIVNRPRSVEITEKVELRRAKSGFKSVMDVDDFVIDLQQEGLMHHHAVVEATITETGDEKWPIGSLVPPLLLHGRADEVVLHLGQGYEENILPMKPLVIKDSYAIGSLLLTLEGVGEGWRDDDITVRPVLHQK